MKIIGHRGYSAKFPENTLMSFQAAIDISADMIEFDVLMSKDGVPVIIHDETLNRTTNGKGHVSLMTLQELKKLDAGQGQFIPTLEEVLQLAKGKIGLHVEIKSEASTNKINGGVEEQVVELIENYGFGSNCIISSFSSVPLFRIKEMKQSLSLAMTFDHVLKDIDQAMVEKLKPAALHLAINHVSEADVDFASVHQLPMNVYTVNTPAQMKKAQDICADGIFTNEIEKAIEYFASRHS